MAYKQSQRVSSQLTIFEGCDGSGKSTMAKAFAGTTKALYVHLGIFPGVTQGLARFYQEAMLPAIWGYRNVVLDRCWMSEPIYGSVMRGGADRVGPVHAHMLERVAWRCKTLVIKCAPPWEWIEGNYTRDTMGGGKGEYVTNVDRMRHVYNLYSTMPTSLPMVTYDYTQFINAAQGLDYLMNPEVERSTPLSINTTAAGNVRGAVCLVGEAFAKHHREDSLQQFPFVSWAPTGSSQWLTGCLAQLGVGEELLFWLNANQPDLNNQLAYFMAASPEPYLLALGDVAYARLNELGYEAHKIPHPAWWLRFRGGERYHPLMAFLRETVGVQV